MNITLNGEPRDVQADMTIRSLIESLSLKPELTAVQLNETIVHRDDVGATMLSDGDVVELIRVVGGG